MSLKIDLRYYNFLPDGYLDEFRESFFDEDVYLSEQEVEPRPLDALEWIVPTAIAIYIGKPFVDAIIKRAADDFGDSVYPRIKNAIATLAKKMYVRDRLPLKKVTSKGVKDLLDASMFSIYSETTMNQRVKFVFNITYAEDEYDVCIDQLFDLLKAHHTSPNGSDNLSQQIAQLPKDRRDRIFLVYDPTVTTWLVRDPVQEALDKNRFQNKVS